MILPDKIYDILKWLDLVIIPAAATFYRAAGAVWGWPLGDEIAATDERVGVEATSRALRLDPRP